jgi:hypothetical protein
MTSALHATQASLQQGKEQPPFLLVFHARLERTLIHQLPHFARIALWVNTCPTRAALSVSDAGLASSQTQMPLKCASHAMLVTSLQWRGPQHAFPVDWVNIRTMQVHPNAQIALLEHIWTAWVQTILQIHASRVHLERSPTAQGLTAIKRASNAPLDFLVQWQHSPHAEPVKQALSQMPLVAPPVSHVLWAHSPTQLQGHNAFLAQSADSPTPQATTQAAAASHAVQEAFPMHRVQVHAHFVNHPRFQQCQLPQCADPVQLATTPQTLECPSAFDALLVLSLLQISQRAHCAHLGPTAALPHPPCAPNAPRAFSLPKRMLQHAMHANQASFQTPAAQCHADLVAQGPTHQQQEELSALPAWPEPTQQNQLPPNAFLAPMEPFPT